VFRYLPPTEVDPGQFGDQVVVDPEERILAMPRVWYGNALQESFTFFAKEAAGAGALVIPAHIDRPQFSVYSQLGFLPEGRIRRGRSHVGGPGCKALRAALRNFRLGCPCARAHRAQALDGVKSVAGRLSVTCVGARRDASGMGRASARN
jgi:hypothetical protein